MANPNWVKGCIAWNKGIPCSKITKEKLREKLKGRKVSKNPNSIRNLELGRGKNREYSPAWCKGLTKETDERVKKIAMSKQGEKHHFFKGHLYYGRRIAREAYPNRCNHCAAEEYLVVHHRNQDQTDNRLENLIILCRKCHKKEHDELRRNG